MIDPKNIASYPALLTEKVRLSDTDRQGHVNNVCFSFFYEAGRAELLLDKPERLDPGCFFVIVTTTVDFIGELHFPGDVVVATGVESIGKTSLSMRQALFQNGRCASVSSSTMVQVNISEKSAQPLSAATRARLEELLMLRPEAE